jgi:hypothetical protein
MSDARIIARFAVLSLTLATPVTMTTSSPALSEETIVSITCKSSVARRVIDLRRQTMWVEYLKLIESVRRTWVFARLGSRSRAATRFRGAHDNREGR